MMRVLSCLTGQHALWLVLLAGIVCVATSLTAVRLFARARASQGTRQRGWILMTGVATGAGVWTSHFLAMLGYDPGLPTAYSAQLTAFSLIVAAASMTAGAAIAILGTTKVARYAGGAVIGAGIGAMHFTGMAAMQTQGIVQWDAGLVGLSLCAGAMLSAIAFGLVNERASLRQLLMPGGVFALAVLALHFTAMGAITITPDPTIAVPPKAISDFILAMAVTTVALLLLGAGNAMDLIYAAVSDDGHQRFHSLVDSSIDGIFVADGDKIVYVNDRICRLLECEKTDLIGQKSLSDILVIPAHAMGPSTAVLEEGTLNAAQGARIPVEVMARPVRYNERDYHIYSLRDQREKRQAQSKIRFLAEHDALTGMPNRTLFNAKLLQALEDADGGVIGIFFIDINRLRDVNDIFGHTAGDAILRGVAARLRALGEEGSLCARLSGDEFVFMQMKSGVEAAERFAEEMTSALSAPFVFGGERITVGCSIGIALSPHDGKMPSELFARAETALNRAKEYGRGKHCFFEAALDEQIHERRALAFDLSNAIAGRQLEVYYQPLSLLPSMEIMGFEALLRWHHPTRGLIAPGVFIPIAEETQVIRELGTWTLRTVCDEAARWPNPLKVAVNLSPIQLEDTSLPEQVQQILFDTGMTADRLELEVTETALMRNPQRSLDVLRRLKALGIRIAMDDFGTGYSSLSTLQAFPFDKIKIDKSFVERVDTHGQAASIVKAVLSLGRSLKIPVLVEGVETERQLAFLTREGAQEIQGFLVGRPQPIARYEPILRKPPLGKSDDDEALRRARSL